MESRNTDTQVLAKNQNGKFFKFNTFKQSINLKSNQSITLFSLLLFLTYCLSECEMLELNWIHASVETVDPLPQLITSEVALKCKAGDEVPYKLSGDKVVTCSLLTSVWMFEENLGQPTCTSTGGKKMDFS